MGNQEETLQKLTHVAEQLKSKTNELSEVQVKYENLKSISESKLAPQLAQSELDPASTRILLEKFSSGIREAQTAKLNLEEQLQEERTKRLDLERQNNFYRISSVQNQRDEIEVERLKAEVSRLRNMVTEYKDQASFYGSNSKFGDKKTVVDQNLAQMQHPLSKEPQISSKQKPSGVSKLDQLAGRNTGIISLTLDEKLSKAMNDHLYNIKTVDWRKVNAQGQGVLFEDVDLRVEVQSKLIKLNNDDKLYCKTIFFFVNKSDFMSILNLSPSFSGHKSKSLL